MKNKISDSEFSSASDFLDDNYEKVFEEYQKKNKDRSLTYRIARGPTALGVVVDILLILVLAINYILYKLQSPYELILFSLIGIWLFYRFVSYLFRSELDILGEPDIEIKEKTNIFEIAPSLSTPEPSHSVYIDFNKNLKHISYIASLSVVALSLGINYFLGGIIDNIGVVFIVILLVYLIYYFAFTLIAFDSVNKRDRALGRELVIFAKKVQENSLSGNENN